MSMESVCRTLKSGELPAENVATYVASFHGRPTITVPQFGNVIRIKTFVVSNFLKSLHGFSLAVKTYQALPSCTISLQLISRPLHRAHWVPAFETHRLTRQEKFCCISMLESGSYNIPPQVLDDVIAISSRNNIFVSELLLQDPYSLKRRDDIKCVVGNVGRTGMVLIVAPPAPRVLEAQLDDFRLVTHAPSDGKRENSFQSTTGHLRFTEFEMALDVGNRGAVDKDLRLVETLVQIFERDKWIADLDILPLFRPGNDQVRRNGIQCTGCGKSKTLPTWLKVIDNWEELLDAPGGMGTLTVRVFGADSNWLARMAAASICLQKGFRIVINPPREVCWHCCCRKKVGWTADTITRTCRAAHLAQREVNS